MNFSSTPRSCAAGWSVMAGQCGTTTRPPVSSAAARNGAAFATSGSTATSRGAISPGDTIHRFGDLSSIRTPRRRSIDTVIAMCPADGSGPPS